MDIMQLSIKIALWIVDFALLVNAIILIVSSIKTDSKNKEKISNLRQYAVFCLTFMCVITMLNVVMF